MESKKDYEIKLQKEIEKFEQKLKKEKRKHYQAKNKYLNRRVKELTKSRGNWKAKQRSNQLTIKVLEHSINRMGKAKGHHFDSGLVSLCVGLRIKAGCTYRSIISILLLLGTNSNHHDSQLQRKKNKSRTLWRNTSGHA
jgi:hypothetical protein